MKAIQIYWLVCACCFSRDKFGAEAVTGRTAEPENHQDPHQQPPQALPPADEDVKCPPLGNFTAAEEGGTLPEQPAWPDSGMGHFGIPANITQEEQQNVTLSEEEGSADSWVHVTPAELRPREGPYPGCVTAAVASCAGRCGEGFSPGDDKMCLCDLDCRHFRDCCLDYGELCTESWHRDSKRERRPVVTETSCSNRCYSDNSISATSCDCFPNCSRRGTCCSDFAQECSNRQQTPPDPVHRAVRPAPYECRPSGNTGTFHWMVASCPAAWRDANVRSQCGKIQLVSAAEGFTGVNLTIEDAVYITPVVDAVSLTTYSNVFCALCNGASHMLESWQLEVQMSCDNSSAPRDLQSLRDGLCQAFLFHFKPPQSFDARRCVPSDPVSLGPTCPVDPSSGLVAYVHSDSVHKCYRNVFSALCHGIDVSDLECGLLVAHFLPEEHQPHFILNNLNLGQLFNFGSLLHGPDRPDTVEEAARCPPSSFYDPITDACRRLYRSPPNLMHPDEPSDWCRNDSVPYNISQVSPQPSGDVVLLGVSDNLTCNATEYLIVENQAYVCKSCLRRYDSGTGIDAKDLYSQTLLTTTMLSLSIASGIGFIAHGVYYRKFSSTPDRLKLQLVVMLTLAECLFISRSFLADLERFCTTVAILLHYCLLATFLSMSSLAFDLFRKLCCAQFSSYGVPYRRYAVFSFGLPLVLVSVCAFLDFSPWTEAFRVGYGGQRCWIDNDWASLLAFGVVVGLVVLSNAYFLVWIVVSLYRSARETAAARAGAEIALMRVCFRITSLMGLTWALGLVAPFVDNAVLWLVFTGLNSAQGLLIVIALTVKNCKACGSKSELSETGKGSLGSSEKGRLYHVTVRQEGCPNISNNITKL